MPYPQNTSQEYGPGPQDPQAQAPDLELLKQLLSQDSQSRGLEFVPRLGQVGGQGGLLGQNPPADSLQSIATPALLDHANAAQQGGNLDVMRALRGVIEKRTPDQVARGQGPQGAAGSTRGVTTAEKEPEGFFNPLKALTDALFNANNGR